MAKLISLSIDVTKLDKSRFYKGKKGTYASLDVWIEDEPDQYGNDASICETQSKEEREAKAKRNYVGNGKKRFGWEDGVGGGASSTSTSVAEEEDPF